MTRFLICGSRDFSISPNQAYIFLNDYIRANNTGTPVIISGMAKGPDLWGYHFGKSASIEVREYPADWATLGKRAGMVRNTKMLGDCDHVIAFWDGKSKGTLNTIQGAKRRTLPLRIVTKTDFSTIKVKLSPQQIAEITHAASNMWGAGKTGAYGKGVIGGGKDPAAPFRTGLSGEYAFGYCWDLPVNTDYSFNGEPWDFTVDINGKMTTLDVKTLSKSKNLSRSPGNIKVGTCNADIYVFCSVEKDYISINGWMDRATILSKETWKSPYGDWQNYSLEWKDLLELSTLPLARER